MPLSRALHGFRYIAKAYQRQRVDKWKPASHLGRDDVLLGVKCQEAGPSRDPASLCATPSLLSFGGCLSPRRVACGDLVRLVGRLEDVLVDEAGHGAAQHTERVPAKVRPRVRYQRR